MRGFVIYVERAGGLFRASCRSEGQRRLLAVAYSRAEVIQKAVNVSGYDAARVVDGDVRQ